MRRILLVVTLAALMAGMVVASALPAFADPNHVRGHHTDETSGEDCSILTCQETFTNSSGGGKQGGGGGGRQTLTLTTHPLVPSVTIDETTQGGNSVDGGGRCTRHFDTSNSSNDTAEGVGSRECV
jgi:hypothetical protein